ncbi:YybH family protein [Roseateles chitosanitabidus]|uniref:YybH family protein n=1 Tax=Roseateles chitosanitabidus TaxID=65048 RepID=UPI0008334076|nr:nuclear transport factor 2 family protein [Roseateles chitosanitabidus]MBO9687960.1 nuclear transport factor 2 family protein [Roseateles chitosanitabidus]
MPDRRTVLRAALALTPVALTAAAAAEPARASDDINPVRDAEIAFAATMARRDFKAFADFVAEDAVFINGKTPLRGRAAVLASWKRFFEGAEAPFSWAPDLVEVLPDGKLGYSTGPVHVKGKLVARFASTWRLDPDGRWRVVFDNGSDVCDCKDAGKT